MDWLGKIESIEIASKLNRCVKPFFKKINFINVKKSLPQEGTRNKVTIIT